MLQHNTFVTRRNYCAVFVSCYHDEFCGVSCSLCHFFGCVIIILIRDRMPFVEGGLCLFFLNYLFSFAGTLVLHCIFGFQSFRIYFMV